MAALQPSDNRSVIGQNIHGFRSGRQAAQFRAITAQYGERIAVTAMHQRFDLSVANVGCEGYCRVHSEQPVRQTFETTQRNMDPCWSLAIS